MHRAILPLLLIVAGITLVPLMATAAPPSASFLSLGKIHPPSTTGFDISFVDNATHLYYLADRTNLGIDVIDVAANPPSGYLGTMTGSGSLAFHNTGVRATSGPDGVLTDKRGTIWAGDGNSTIKDGTLASGVTESISTCPAGAPYNGDAATCKRADELSYDPEDEIILIANANAVPAPFLTFISTAPGSHGVLGHYIYPTTQVGLEQSVWDSQTHLFYQAVPGKGIDVFDPHTMLPVQSFPLPCTDGPSGLALAVNQKLAAACGDGGYFVNVRTGQIHKVIPEVGGADEIWFNPGDHNVYFARSGAQSLGVVNGDDDHFVTNLPTAAGAHSVAASASNNHIFVPVNDGSGILVFASQENPVHGP